MQHCPKRRLLVSAGALLAPHHAPKHIPLPRMQFRLGQRDLISVSIRSEYCANSPHFASHIQLMPRAVLVSHRGYASAAISQEEATAEVEKIAVMLAEISDRSRDSGKYEAVARRICRLANEGGINMKDKRTADTISLFFHELAQATAKTSPLQTTCNYTRVAKSVKDSLAYKNIPMTMSMYNNLLKMLTWFGRDTKGACDLLDHMEKANLKTNFLTYKLVIDALVSRPNRQKSHSRMVASNLWKAMRYRQSASAKGITMNPRTTLLMLEYFKALSKVPRSTEVMSDLNTFFKDLSSHEYDTRCYNTYLEIVAMRSSYMNLMKSFYQMYYKGFKPDEKTFQIMLLKQYKHGEMAEMKDFVKWLQRSQTDANSLDKMIEGFYTKDVAQKIRSGDLENWENAFDRIEIEPGDHAHLAVLNAIIEKGNIAEVEKWLATYVQKGKVPTSEMIEAVLSSYTSIQDDTKRYIRVRHLVVALSKWRIQFSKSLQLAVLKSVKLTNSSKKFERKWFNLILDEGFGSRREKGSLVLSCCIRLFEDPMQANDKAESWFQRIGFSMEESLQPKVETMNELLQHCADNDLQDQGKRWYDRLKQLCIPNSRTMNVLRELNWKGEVDLLSQVNSVAVRAGDQKRRLVSASVVNNQALQKALLSKSILEELETEIFKKFTARHTPNQEVTTLSLPSRPTRKVQLHDADGNEFEFIERCYTERDRDLVETTVEMFLRPTEIS